jgi:flagellin
MGLRINTNIAAMNAYRNLSITSTQMSKSLEKLSSGYRINRAADDAAGLAISEGLRSQIGGLKVAARNTQDAINVVQTADGSLNETTAILQRMRDLSVQAANGGSQDANAQAAADTEFQQLKDELDRIANTTQFDGKKLLDGNYQGTFQVGANNTSDDQITVDLSAAGLTADTGYTAGGSATAGKFVGTDTLKADYSSTSKSFTVDGKTVTLDTDLSASTDAQIQAAVQTAADAAGVSGVTFGVASGALTVTGSGADAPVVTGLAGTATEGTSGTQTGVNGFTAANLGLGSSDLLNMTDAQAAMDAVDNAIKGVSTARANLGAYQNRFEHTINNINVAVENLSASESAIRDTDMAQEMVNFTRTQILSQAGTAMLAQANQIPSGVLRLLQ